MPPTDAQAPPQGPDRRNQLAADRTIFAAERTYAAWVRTGLAALASGVGAQKLLQDIIPDWSIRVVASILVLLAPSASRRRSGARSIPGRRRPGPTRAGSRPGSWSPSTASWSWWTSPCWSESGWAARDSISLLGFGNPQM